MGATVVEKIARAHMVDGPDRPLRPGDMVTLRPRHILTHDNTWSVMAKFAAIGAERVADPAQPVVVLDHDIQNTSPENVDKYRRIREFCRAHGLAFHPEGTGIGHQIMIERGFALPGALVVASDSHANTYGAVGALGTPVVRTDAAAIWATAEFWWQVPRTVQVRLEGALPEGVSGKDLILTLCHLYDQGEALNAAVEFSGPGVASLTMADRMSIANMTTEWGALVGWFPVDERTVEYLDARKERLELVHRTRISDDDIQSWGTAPPAPDPDAHYAARITVDLADVRPFLAGPDTVQAGRSVADAERERIAIDKAYLLSCVNGRLEDLQAAAAVLRGQKVAEGVELYVAAASREIQDRAESDGTWSDLLEAGAIPLPPGCGPCIGLGAGLLGPGEVGVSATNRNFKGRMGARDAQVFLAAPAVVAASAVAGHITDGGLDGGTPTRSYEERDAPALADEDVEILDGFPARVEGRLVWVHRRNLNTDGIYGKEHTYQDRTPEEMAAVVMANYDPTFAERVGEGDVLVGSWNFGTGSSREQAATALQARGIALVIAGSFSQTYLRNAFNNGLICVESPGLVRAVEAALGTDEATAIPGDELAVDFRRGAIRWRDEEYRFPALGRVPQGLVVAGGVEAQVRERLA
ncbi:MAG: aconitase/3-isopropylmalate dehydratase large subunit family protein, partial [Gemmatimonadota bacterium]